VLFPETSRCRHQLVARSSRLSQDVNVFFVELLDPAGRTQALPHARELFDRLGDEGALIEDLFVHVQNVTLGKVVDKNVPFRQKARTNERDEEDDEYRDPRATLSAILALIRTTETRGRPERGGRAVLATRDDGTETLHDHQADGFRSRGWRQSGLRVSAGHSLSRSDSQRDPRQRPARHLTTQARIRASECPAVCGGLTTVESVLDRCVLRDAARSLRRSR
jgi:hypothetical protein